MSKAIPFFIGSLFCVQVFAFAKDVETINTPADTIYKAQSQSCSVEVLISKKMPDHGQIKNSCSLADSNSLKALDAILTTIAPGSGPLKLSSLLVGKPDGDPVEAAPTFHLRLAKLLMESKEWDARKGKVLKGRREDLVLKLLQKENPLPELFEVFKKHSIQLTYASVEEFYTLKTRVSGKYYPSIQAKPTDVFPDSFNIYLQAKRL